MDVSRFNSSPLEGHLGFSQCLAIVKEAAMNIGVQVFV